MEAAAFEMKSLARPPHPALSGAKNTEVFGCPGSNICKKTDDYTTSLLATDLNVQEYPG